MKPQDGVLVGVAAVMVIGVGVICFSMGQGVSRVVEVSPVDFEESSDYDEVECRIESRKVTGCFERVSCRSLMASQFNDCMLLRGYQRADPSQP